MQEKRLRRRHPLVQTFLDNWLYIIVLIILWRLPYLIAEWTNSQVAPESPRIASESKFWQSVLIEVYILAILAISYNLLFGFTGIISFGHGLFFGVGGYTVAILVDQHELSLARSVGVALAIGVIFGLIWSIASFRIKGVYFAMFTLAFAQIFLELSRLTIFDSITRGDDGLTWTVPDWISPVKNRLMMYNITLAVLVLSFMLVRRLMNSPSGKVILALRENEARAQTLGFNIYLYKTMAITLSGFLATAAGILHGMLNRQVAPSSLGLERTVDPLIQTLVGGTGTIPGPVIGATLLRFGQEFLKKSELLIDIRFVVGRYTTTVNSEHYWGLALGMAFIIFVMIVPYGVVGSLNRIWVDSRRWLRRYLYNPVVRKNPNIAFWMEPITGEPPEFAQTLAEITPTLPLMQWIRAYPGPSMNSLIALVFFGLWLVTGSWRIAIEWATFLLLLSLPIRLADWFMRIRSQSSSSSSIGQPTGEIAPEL